MASKCDNLKPGSSTIQSVENQTIEHVEHLHTIEAVTPQQSFWNGFSWAAGASMFSSVTYVTYKVGNIAYNAFIGVKVGAAAGAPLGPYLAIPMAAAGGTAGAVKGLFT